MLAVRMSLLVMMLKSQRKTIKEKAVKEDRRAGFPADLYLLKLSSCLS
ncbi:hypothetical protein SAMN03080615_02552 [Amphritea atlantica]|uniref:Uncharacterized protein n=1 Tax=Amphritea atlantica TaxID=355243 RepID=A0A1H9IGW2_9GAMM|nr:hypothetical protein SAMN03080615_02552 [Amphritea atlantica]